MLKELTLGSEKFPELSQQWHRWVNYEDSPEDNYSELDVKVLV